ncbi:hypothetical protein ARMGADRAFT_1012335 [Armillaria gallica]|uniref:Uncharacterized protein n=1 Tax=Armillaria gallica TaxID=47427 RepID=A0A2H3DHX8_ARMGA|nr:hypothetical protein ARMGADRAFT_1012335 [Armillaria gallica]
MLHEASNSNRSVIRLCFSVVSTVLVYITRVYLNVRKNPHWSLSSDGASFMKSGWSSGLCIPGSSAEVVGQPVCLYTW